MLRGKAAVLDYYRDGLAASPGLHFTLVEVGVGVDAVAIVYRNHREMLVVEWLNLDDDGMVCAVSVAYPSD